MANGKYKKLDLPRLPKFEAKPSIGVRRSRVYVEREAEALTKKLGKPAGREGHESSMARAGKVYVAMSGGVDSSVAALLLKKRGFDVVGVFMKPWQTPGVRCLWQADRQDALRVAHALEIPLLTWDFSKAYGSKVVRNLLAGYKRGLTPNPDVLCNKDIKFGLFYEKALKLGADFIATGHYARVRGGQLLRAKDANKDQTYFLWAIKPEYLEKLIFPIGHLLKPQVRQLASQAGLVTAAKKDSQGVCFVGDIDFKAFLMAHLKPKSGPILHVDGRQLGQHDGAMYYTIGQRHGLDIKDGGGPYFVVRTDIKKNLVVVGSEQDLLSQSLRLTKTNWFGATPKPGTVVSVKVRYRTPSVSAIVGPNNQLTFQKPARAIAPGQSAVLYQGQRLLGGGIITI